MINAASATISLGAAGRNDLPIVMMGRRTDIQFAVSTGTYLTAEQIAAVDDELLYVSVHSQVFPNGELRGQVMTDTMGE